MSFDGFFTKAMTHELKEKLLGGRISKIYQPFEQEIHFVIRSNRKNYRLLATIHPVYYRLHLTQDRPINPQNAPMFNMILRKHIENSSILDIRQVENDRMIIFNLSGRDELGDIKTYQLIFELMGKHSNLLLVDPQEQRIIDCIKHVSSSLNSYRGLQPGATYLRPPKQDRQVDITALSDQDLMAFSLKNHAELESGQVQKVVQGLGKLGKNEINYYIQEENLSPYKALQLFLGKLDPIQASLYKNDKQVSYYFNDLSSLKGQKVTYKNLSELLDDYYGQKVHSDRLNQLSGDILQKVQQIIKRNQVKLAKLEKDKEKALNSEKYRIYGELLSAFSHQVTKGMASVSLPNYYDEDNKTLDIPLDTSKSPIENSQAYFKKYAKYRDSLKFIEKQSKKTLEENHYLEGILVQLEQADLEDIEAIKDELTQEKYFNRKNKSIKKRSQAKTKPRRFKSTDGVMIYVGRNNQQNDELSLKKASKNHWWLHTKDIPGAHVIIESDQPSETTFNQAAMIAAYYSRASQSANVPVDTVQVKQIRKPNGAKPGFVIYEGQTTLFTTPDAKKIKDLSLDNNI